MKRITVHDKTTLPTVAAGGLVRASVGEPDSDARPTPYVIEDATFGGQILRPLPSKQQQQPAPVSITVQPMAFSAPRQFMHTRPADAAESLNSQIERHAARSAAALGMAASDFGHPGVTTPARITVAGRIVGEAEGKLRERGILLESSRQMGSGCRVPLELEDGVPVSLFPGQIAILEGSNPDGTAFHVSAQRQPVLLSPPTRRTVSPFTMIVACGPYTLDSDSERLDFEPLEKLLNFIHDQRPDVLVMMGPFVDAENPSIKQGACSKLPEDIFKGEILWRLGKVTSRLPSLQVIMVPSTRDLLTDNVYPQPIPPAARQPGLDATFVSNPAIISVNSVTIAMSSSDVLLPLGMEEYFRDSANADRMHRLCSYLHQQVSFFPLHPAPAGCNIDYALLSELELSGAPDIWLSSSQLRYFAKDVEGTLHVNAGQFCRRQAKGTAAFITVTSACDKRVDFYQF